MKDMNALKMIVVAFAIAALASCATTTQKINDLVDDTVRNSENLTEEEWAERDGRLEELLRQYEANPDAFTEEERQSIDYALGQYYGAQVKQGLQDVKEDHAAYAETDAWVQGNPPFEVKGKPSVIPEPASGGELHDIASCKFHNGSDHNDPQEDQERSDQEFTDIDAFFLKPGQGKDKDQCPEPINDAVRSEKYTPV